MNNNIDVVVDNTQVLAVGGDLHGKLVDVDYVEGAVYILDGQSYVGKTMYDGSTVLVASSNAIENYVLTAATFI